MGRKATPREPPERLKEKQQIGSPQDTTGKGRLAKLVPVIGIGFLGGVGELMGVHIADFGKASADSPLMSAAIGAVMLIALSSSRGGRSRIASALRWASSKLEGAK